MKKILTASFKGLIILVLFIPSLTSAQPFIDLVNLKSQMALPTPYTGESKNNLSIRQNEGTFLLPLVQKDGSALLIGADFTNLNFQTSGQTGLHSNLYSTSLLLGYEKQWKNKKWKTAFIALPKINSSFQNLSMSDMQMGGIVLFKYQENDNLKFHFGGYYNREYFGNLVIPIVGIDWNINKHWNLFGDMPISMTLEYKVAKRFFVGTTFYSTIASFRPDGSTDTYVRQGDKGIGDNQIKLFVSYYIARNIALYAEGGQSFGRMFQLYDSKNMPVSNDPIYEASADGLFFDIGVAFRVRMDGK